MSILELLDAAVKLSRDMELETSGLHLLAGVSARMPYLPSSTIVYKKEVPSTDAGQPRRPPPLHFPQHVRCHPAEGACDLTNDRVVLVN